MALQGRRCILSISSFRSKSCSGAVALTRSGFLGSKSSTFDRSEAFAPKKANFCHTRSFTPVRTGLGGDLLLGYTLRSGRLRNKLFVSLRAHTSRYRHSKMATLETLNFDNVALRSLPVDPVTENVPRKVTGACFSLVKPTPVEKPEVVAVSMPALSLLDLGEQEAQRKEFDEYFSGNRILPGSKTAAHCYCGHQFGNFAGQLGDGAAMYLGEVVNKSGERWEIQIKGAGPTPYSRTADGRKVLRSSIREFLCSEAMHHLGIPTTRAGCCITSDTTVQRDVYYTGHPIEEKCTIVLRIAETFIRFGSFQICDPPHSSTGKDGPSVGRIDVLEALTNYVLKMHYPQIHEQYGADKKAACREMFKEIVLRTARLVAQWQCVGWCHGVLNTDNMSILGLTIDYGPYAFLDRYDPTFVSNDSDKGGRYAYEKQPEACRWSLERLAFSLAQLPYMDMTEFYQILEMFYPEYESTYLEIMRKKFGLFKCEPEDINLVESFMKTMEETGADFTNSFRCLSRLHLPGSPDFAVTYSDVLEHLLDECSSLEELLKVSQPKMEPRELQMTMMLLEMNPQLLDQLGISVKSIYDDIKCMEKMKQLKEKTAQQKHAEDKEHWTKWLDSYTERLKRECNDDIISANEQREKIMNSTNPRLVLRNYIAQYAIDAAERGDYSEVRHLVQLLQDPYSSTAEMAPLAKSTVEQEVAASMLSDGTAVSGACCRIHVPIRYDARPPLWAIGLKLT